jgi:hypothetical protein
MALVALRPARRIDRWSWFATINPRRPVSYSSYDLNRGEWTRPSHRWCGQPWSDWTRRPIPVEGRPAAEIEAAFLEVRLKRLMGEANNRGWW